MTKIEVGKYYKIAQNKGKTIRHVFIEKEYKHMYLCKTIPLAVFDLSTAPYSICINKNDLICGHELILKELTRNEAYNTPQIAGDEIPEAEEECII